MSVVRAQEQASFVGLEVLEQRQLLAATPTAVTTVRETEPNDRQVSANSFVLPDGGGVKLRGRFQTANDRDLFTFTATTSGQVLVNLQQRQGAFPRLRVKLAGGKNVFRIEPNSTDTFGQFRIRVGKTYIVQFNRNEPIGSNKYEAQLRISQGGARSRDDQTRNRDRRTRIKPGKTQYINEREINNSKGAANAFSFPTLNTVTVISGVSNNTTDRDFFSFRALRTGTMRFSIKDLNSAKASRPVYLKVVSKSGVVVGEIETNGNGKAKRFDGFVDQGQTYFILARARQFNRTFYQINTRFIELF